MGLNLSDWALRHRSFVIFLMIASMVAGAVSYTTLGRNEDPPFTFRTMVVQANWPGATLEETVEQVTERLERKLQEVENVDFLRSFTRAGVTRIFVNLEGSTPPEQVPDLWYDVRKKIGDIRHTLPQGVVGPFFNDEFGDTFGIIYGFTADGFTQRELRDYVEEVRSRLLLVPDVTKIDLLGAQDEQIFIEFSTERLAGLGLNQAAILAGLRAQNVVRPAGVVRTDDEEFALRVTGAFAVRAGPARDEFRRRRPAAAAARHRDGAPRLRRPAAVDVPRQRQARDRPRDRHARRRRRPRARRERRGGDQGDHGRPARRHHAGAGGEPAAGRGRRRSTSSWSRCGRRSRSSW